MENRLEAAKRLINAFGYVIIAYRTKKPVGFITNHLWGAPVQYPFAIIGTATLEEWERQLPIMEAVEPGAVKYSEDPAKVGYPYLYKFMTD